MTELVAPPSAGPPAARPARRTSTARRQLAGAAGAAVLLACTLALAGCASAPDNPLETGAGPVRTDREIIEKAYPELAGFTEVRWVTGQVDGGRGSIGPSDHYRQAVLTMPVETVAGLLERFRFEPSDPPAQVVSGLEPFLPPGAGWRESQAFTFTPAPDWFTSVYVRPGSPTVYVTSTSH